ncbi:hypothetical protein [Streptomyces sp. BK340]|uniref:hypothetical protein n=1 Tax=Streptomyces sp. BK340 TaxID=2572903 RepID=UPI00119E32D0|nr:hypothetical protein [Streptomyces sp. BK340]TVZ96504.1 hypothetical protein FB157_103415 [Streptomyces sp. BK340]
MPDPTPEQIRASLADCNLRRHAWRCFQESTRRNALRIARITDRKDTPMTQQTAALPVDPARLADLLLAPGADSNTLYRQLAGQVGPRPARQALAGAHSIAAERLWAETA